MLYLAAVIDWHSKAILSYKISNIQVINITSILHDKGIFISMNGKGRSKHNIAIERLFRTLKYKNIHISDYNEIKELKEGVKNWMYKYNFKRFHSSLNYKKPMNVYLSYVENVV